jgi:LuxR family maltose regulon positive regulatory protein
LALAQPEGYVRVFLSGGAPAARFLAAVPLEGGRMEAYRRRLLSAFREEDTARRPVTPGSPSPPPPKVPGPLIDPLTPRELQVLNLVAQGRSNRQIAVQLSISPHTVKWHAGNIYGKLSVANRTQAVARARELDLLPPSPSLTP